MLYADAASSSSRSSRRSASEPAPISETKADEEYKDEFDNYDDEVNMWVFEEQVDGRNLTDIINTEHENVKYLPVSAHAHHRVAGAHIRRWPLVSLA